MLVPRKRGAAVQVAARTAARADGPSRDRVFDARRHLGRLPASLVMLDELPGLMSCRGLSASARRQSQATTGWRPKTSPSKPARVIGCDVGKARIAVFDSRDGRSKTIANEINALTGFVAELDDTRLVVHEAGLLAALVEAGRAAHRADARKVKAFIRSFGILGKSDAIDAKALARYGQERHAELTRWQPRDASSCRPWC